MRKPQWGSAVVSTATCGQRLVATQSCVPDPLSIPHPPPTIPESPAASLPPSAAVLADLSLPPPPCESCSIPQPTMTQAANAKRAMIRMLARP